MVLPVWCREPLLHFLLAGAAIFGVSRLARGSDPTSGRQQIVVDAELRNALREEFAESRGRPPAAAELDAAMDRWIADEVMFREALALGLERHDPGVRRRLVQQMGYVLTEGVATAEPSARDLAEHLRDHRTRFDAPARVDFEQVFARGLGPDVRRRAFAWQQQLSAGSPPERLGDDHPNGRRFTRRDRADLERLFGERFVPGLFEQPPNEWVVRRSREGWHVVRITKRWPAHRASLDDANDYAAVADDWRAVQKRATAEDVLAALREEYEVVIAP